MNLLRLTWIGVCLARCLASILLHAALGMVTGRGCCLPAAAGRSLAGAAEAMGGAFLKAAQILSTRVDLLPSQTISELSRLRDNVTPVPFYKIEPALNRVPRFKEDLGLTAANCVLAASGTIAQVYVAVDRSLGLDVAIKVRRPGVADIIAGDVRMIRRIIGLASRLPRLRSLPIREATEEVCSGLLRQVDFGREMRTLKRFMALFADCDEATVPEVIEAKCTDEVIVMQYLSGYAPVVVRRNIKEDREAVRSGLRALYRMIFEAGLVHCDMHAGNILRGADGRVALIDFGFVAEMEPVAKHEFARFFIAIIFRNGPMAADSVRRTARHVARWHDPLAFEDDMQRLVDSVGGKKASEFQVARFVYELFELQRSHGIYGSPDFTLPILSLLAYEGMIKELYPDLDFQQEAVPFIMACLAEPSQPVVPGGQGSVLDRMSNGRAMPHQAAIPPVVDS